MTIPKKETPKKSNFLNKGKASFKDNVIDHLKFSISLSIAFTYLPDWSGGASFAAMRLHRASFAELAWLRRPKAGYGVGAWLWPSAFAKGSGLRRTAVSGASLAGMKDDNLKKELK